MGVRSHDHARYHRNRFQSDFGESSIGEVAFTPVCRSLVAAIHLLFCSLFVAFS
ncbi:hypothetical protein [Methanococcoides alaskense]|uniref:Uncharacterized protein n=1 Tax=Methanococcoides alaskense TaxID=325778 RepID=A0AA90TZC9_9EURY|nr:hypothetical protein [Methanococcoides alaskense]MDA0524808.1 hypothetical protein [Methanococcoides alaskense]MDR6223068.1 hypothetical protein [Methanococcoides alaskense]